MIRTLRFLFAALLLVGCEEGPNPETLVDDVQVIAAVAEPLAVAPGEPWTLSTTVADPKDRGAEVLLWACLEDDCAVERVAPEDEVASLDLVSTIPIPMWILACDPGICDLDNPRPADLKDPFSWMQRLPLEGVSLSTRQVNILEQPEDPSPDNPVIELEPTDNQLRDAQKGDSRKLEFAVSGAQVAWGYSTAGGFASPSEDIAEDGTVTLTWFAPEKRGTVRLYVVFEDDEFGGTVVWRGEVAVR